MTQFQNLKGAVVSPTAVARFTFHDIEGEPWVEVRSAGEINKPYFNAVLKRTAKNRRMQRGQIDTDTLERNRNEDRELYPQHILTGKWGGWKDENGTDIPFSLEGARELMQQLPSYQFDGLRSYCNEPTNFREDVLNGADAEAVSGNSLTG
jgi:hypothetical protein